MRDERVLVLCYRARAVTMNDVTTRDDDDTRERPQECLNIRAPMSRYAMPLFVHGG